MIAVFAGVTAALGLIPPVYLPLAPVPITAQSLGPILAGAVLGARRGAASQLLFLSLVALGLPLLAGGRGGIGVFAGPTVGFLLGWVVVALVVGALTWRKGAPYRVWFGVLVNAIGGIVVLYPLGILGMVGMADLSWQAALLANVPFLVGDALKVVAAAFIAKGVHASYPGLLPWNAAWSASARSDAHAQQRDATVPMGDQSPSS